MKGALPALKASTQAASTNKSRDEAADGRRAVRRASRRRTSRSTSAHGDGYALGTARRSRQVHGDRDRVLRVEDDARRADEALNAMSPDEGGGRRTGAAEIYEVVLDESFG